jgi:uncharacterized NAD(P)/FAD-binding protein YdhS
LHSQPIVNKSDKKKRPESQGCLILLLMETVVIIGGGFGGMSTAVSLLMKSKNISIRVINKDHPAGRGVAYDTAHPEHILNVPVSRMSAPDDQPLHFREWLRSRPEYSEFHNKEYVPRAIYGNYLDHFFAPFLRSEQLQFTHARAINILPQETQYKVLLDNNSAIIADYIVLAMGNDLPAPPRGLDPSLDESAGYFSNPWNRNFLKDLKETDSIVLIGTGLSMVDCMLSMKKCGFKGKITITSPRGYTPAPHVEGPVYPGFYEELEGKDLLSIFRSVRKHIAKAAADSIPWQAVIDSLRLYAGKIWLNLSEKEKQQFISHIRHIWGVARHRLPQETHAELMRMIDSGQAEIIAGRITNLSKTTEGISAVIRQRKEQNEKTIRATRVVNCTGPQLNFKESPDPLIRNLVASGLIVPHELKVGLKALPDCAVIRSDGSIPGNIFSLGSFLRGVLWETTAVPEIRAQAEKIAKQICGK